MKYALITGASSGIGAEFAKLFARNKHHLVLVARRKDKLLQLAAGLEKVYSINTLVIQADLSQADSAREIFRQVQNQSIAINYLVNNAGFYIKGGFSETSWEEEQQLIRMQCLSYTGLTKLFLPGMLRQGSGGILNIGSTGSFVPGPYNAVYCAAKSFVLSFSEALARELKGSGVTVTALCPGGTKTDFQDFESRKNSVFFPVMEASKLAEIGYTALMKGKRVVVPGVSNKILVFMVRFIPRNLVTRLSGSMVER
ncbi:SDR family NAD(P)-dependent oxidoreductase [Bacteroidota bacterium]